MNEHILPTFKRLKDNKTYILNLGYDFLKVSPAKKKGSYKVEFFVSIADEYLVYLITEQTDLTTAKEVGVNCVALGAHEYIERSSQNPRKAKSNECEDQDTDKS